MQQTTERRPPKSRTIKGHTLCWFWEQFKFGLLCALLLNVDGVSAHPFAYQADGFLTETKLTNVKRCETMCTRHADCTKIGFNVKSKMCALLNPDDSAVIRPPKEWFMLDIEGNKQQDDIQTSSAPSNTSIHVSTTSPESGNTTTPPPPPELTLTTPPSPITTDILTTTSSATTTRTTPTATTTDPSPTTTPSTITTTTPTSPPPPTSTTDPPTTTPSATTATIRTPPPPATATTDPPTTPAPSVTTTTTPTSPPPPTATTDPPTTTTTPPAITPTPPPPSPPPTAATTDPTTTPSATHTTTPTSPIDITDPPTTASSATTTTTPTAPPTAITTDQTTTAPPATTTTTTGGITTETTATTTTPTTDTTTEMPICPVLPTPTITQTFRDCKDHFDNAATADGVYLISPDGATQMNAWCDMTNGGWTVFQKRFDGSVDFYRTWYEYRSGFGDPNGEHWLGLEHVYQLTTLGSTELKIRIKEFSSDAWNVVTYKSFSLGPCEDWYRLSVGTVKSPSGCDSLRSVHNGMPFSTFDNKDHAVEPTWNCGGGGGWWYNRCGEGFLNNAYLPAPGTYGDPGGRFITWYCVTIWKTSLEKTEMMFKRI